MFHWDVYSYLKQVNGKTSVNELMMKFPDEEDVREGIVEYNEMTKENPYYEEMKI